MTTIESANLPKKPQKNIFTDELSLTGGLPRATMKALYNAVKISDLPAVKKLLPSYTPSLRGAIFTRRAVYASELDYAWKDMLSLGQNDGAFEKASVSERLEMYKRSKQLIDNYPARYPGNVEAEIATAKAYVNFAHDIYNNDLDKNQQYIDLARQALSQAVAIYERHPEQLFPVKDISTLPLPEVAEKHYNEQGKRTLRNKAMNKELGQILFQGLDNVKTSKQINNTLKLQYAKSVLAQPATLLDLEEGLVKNMQVPNPNLLCESPLINRILLGLKQPVHGFTEEEKYKGKHKTILAQKEILDYLGSISRNDYIGQIKVAQGYARLASVYTNFDAFNERTYVDTAFKFMKEAVALYKKQPIEARNSNTGIEAGEAIAGNLANLYAFHTKNNVKKEEILELLQEGRTLFPHDLMDSAILIGRHSGPARLLQNTARILVRQNKYNEAIPLLEKSIRDNNSAPDSGVADILEHERDYGPYDLLAYAYSKTGQPQKSINLLIKLRNNLVKDDITKAQYSNRQIDVTELLKPYGYNVPKAPQHVLNAEEQTKIEEKLEDKKSFENASEQNQEFVSNVLEFVQLNRKIIKNHLEAGNIDTAKEEQKKIQSLVNGVDTQVQKAGVAGYAQMANLLQYEVLRTSKHFADFGIDGDLIKLNTAVAGKYTSMVEEKIDSIPAKLASATYVEEKYCSPKLKNAIRGMFQNLWKVKELQPLLTAASLGTEGKLNNGEKLGFIFTHEGNPEAHGFYQLKNLVQISMLRTDRKKGILDKENIALMQNTLIHEMTHYIAHQVYKNISRPYPANDEKAKENFRDAFHDDVHKAREYIKVYEKDIDNSLPEQQQGKFGSLQASAMRILGTGYIYDKDERDGEYIVRIPHSLSKIASVVGANHAGEILKEAVPGAYKHFTETFTSDINKMVTDAQIKHKIAAPLPPQANKLWTDRTVANQSSNVVKFK